MLTHTLPLEKVGGVLVWGDVLEGRVLGVSACELIQVSGEIPTQDVTAKWDDFEYRKCIKYEFIQVYKRWWYCGRNGLILGICEPYNYYL